MKAGNTPSPRSPNATKSLPSDRRRELRGHQPAAQAVQTKPLPPKETIQVKAIRPERDHLEIHFPRVTGYRVELPEDRLEAVFDEDSTLVLTPELVGATETQASDNIGETFSTSSSRSKVTGAKLPGKRRPP